MNGTHVRYQQDNNGDLVDVFYFCSRGCWDDSFREERLGLDTASIGGAAPCAASEPGAEIDVYCAECGVLMASPDKETPVVVNLIARPPIDPVTNRAYPQNGELCPICLQPDNCGDCDHSPLTNGT